MIRKKQKSDKMIIDLDGPEGNAYNLIGVANLATPVRKQENNQFTFKLKLDI